MTETYAVALGLGVLGVGAGSSSTADESTASCARSTSPVVLLALASIPALLAAQFASAILLGADRYEGYATLLLTNAAVTLVVSVRAWPFRSV